MNKKEKYNIEYRDQRMVGSLHSEGREAAETKQPTHHPPPHMRFRYLQA